MWKIADVDGAEIRTVFHSEAAATLVCNQLNGAAKKFYLYVYYVPPNTPDQDAAAG